MRDAILAGLRYVRGAPLVRSILIRTGAFSVACEFPARASPNPGPSPWRDRLRPVAWILWSWRPCRRGRAASRAYSVFSGWPGFLRHNSLRRYDSAAGRVQTFSWLCLVLFVCGTAWIGILACLNIAAQTMCPSFLRARALSMYLLDIAGWHGAGKHGLGSSGHANRRPRYTLLFGRGVGRWFVHRTPTPLDVRPTGTDAVSSSRLISNLEITALDYSTRN